MYPRRTQKFREGEGNPKSFSCKRGGRESKKSMGYVQNSKVEKPRSSNVVGVSRRKFGSQTKVEDW